MEPIRNATDFSFDYRMFLEYYDLADPRDGIAFASEVSTNAWLVTSDLFIARMYSEN